MHITTPQIHKYNLILWGTPYKCNPVLFTPLLHDNQLDAGHKGRKALKPTKKICKCLKHLTIAVKINGLNWKKTYLKSTL